VKKPEKQRHLGHRVCRAKEGRLECYTTAMALIALPEPMPMWAMHISLYNCCNIWR